MKIYKAYKFRMYPDLDNTIKLNQFLGVKRFIYNYYLSKKDLVYKNENRNYTIKEMIQNNNKTLKKNIINSSFGEILRILKYKSTWYNKKYINIDTYYPSSKICNHCGYKNKKVFDLSVRKYNCDNCGYELDRDINASINIMWEGFKKIYNLKEIAS